MTARQPPAGGFDLQQRRSLHFQQRPGEADGQRSGARNGARPLAADRQDDLDELAVGNGEDADVGARGGARDGLGQHVDEDLPQGARLGNDFDALGKGEAELDLAAGSLALDERPGVG